MQNTNNLVVARHAQGLAVHVYRVTAAFPPAEQYGLTSQMRRSAVSIGSNIAEGCGRRGVRALVSFLYIAMGSASELEFQALLARELGIVAPPLADSLVAEIRRLKRMLSKLIAALRKQTAGEAEG
ncbi:MAG TPA: four helix bundle protein [Gemmatimonadaceae bacterium]|nr:four helix bundle protein [Gemmatimonadaceae bacterium]